MDSKTAKELSRGAIGIIGIITVGVATWLTGEPGCLWALIIVGVIVLSYD